MDEPGVDSVSPSANLVPLKGMLSCPQTPVARAVFSNGKCSVNLLWIEEEEMPWE